MLEWVKYIIEIMCVRMKYIIEIRNSFMHKIFRTFGIVTLFLCWVGQNNWAGELVIHLLFFSFLSDIQNCYCHFPEHKTPKASCSWLTFRKCISTANTYPSKESGSSQTVFTNTYVTRKTQPLLYNYTYLTGYPYYNQYCLLDSLLPPL